MKIIGADIALKHGAFVDQNGNILYTYHNKKGIKTSFAELFQISLSACLKIPLRSEIVIDWDMTSISWGGNILSKVLINNLIAVFSTMCIISRKSRVYTVPPSIVRKCLNIPFKTSKEDVHKLFSFPRSLNKLELTELTRLEKEDIIGDIKDAWILTQILECAKEYQNG